MSDVRERVEEFKILMPRPNYRAEMLEMTQYVMDACVELAEKYGMDLNKVHMWDETFSDGSTDQHYATFRVVVEFPSSRMWLDTCVIERDVGTSRPVVTTFSTHRDLDRKTIWSNYVFSLDNLDSIFKRYHNA